VTEVLKSARRHWQTMMELASFSAKPSEAADAVLRR
jgi:hypothetical protein